MAFDAKSGHLNCDSCGRTDQIESMAGDKSIPKDATVTYDMDDDDIKELAKEKLKSSGKIEDISAFVPFMDEDDIGEIIKHMISK